MYHDEIVFRRRCFTSSAPGVVVLSAPHNPRNPGPEPEIVRVRLPKKKYQEQFARAESMLGANHISVRCSDGITRLGRIKGKIKKRLWIREGDLLIIIPWSFQDDKCDISYRYTRHQVEWLQRNGHLNL